MFTSICNFLYDTFFHKPEIKFLRRKNVSSESSFGKRLKFSERVWNSNSQPSQNNSLSSFSMQKENAEYSDDEECCIIAEMPRRKKAGSSLTTDHDGAATSNHSSGLYNWPSFSFNRDLEQEHNKDIQEVKCVSNSSGKIVISNSQFKNKFFNNMRTPLSQGKMAKSKMSFRNHLRKKLNFLQEMSYRLTEKLQYMELLQSQTLLSLQSQSPLRKIKCKPECIPVIDLTDDTEPSSEQNLKSYSDSQASDDQDIQIIGEITGVRSFQDILKIKTINTEETLEGILSRKSKHTTHLMRVKELSDPIDNLLDDDPSEESCTNKKLNFDSLEEKLKNYVKITCPISQKAYNFKEHHVPEFTKEQEEKISNALIPEPKQEILVKGFGLHITRHDMQTLKGLNWLNDVVIDFYMNLIMERSKLSNALPKVYAFNTFFYPKLVISGYDGLQRWTKRVDIFSFDMILVPIHLGMHWCLSIIHFKSKSIQYFDSIGTPNDKCLDKLLLYLKAEWLQKKNTLFHTTDWEKCNVKDIPQQMNGSDCGVFSCMFAEYVTRGCNITFSQSDMPYFRKKMVIEILEKKLLT